MQQNPKKISKFVLILQNLLDGAQHQNIIKWTNDGAGVQILNRKQLQHKILPLHFSQHKITSFTRQLHLYGFYKTKDPLKNDVFEHPLFLKQCRSNYYLIKRKYKEKLPLEEKQSLPTMTNQEKQSPEVIMQPHLSSIRSFAQIKNVEDKEMGKQAIFEDWYHSNDDDLSLMVDDFFN